MTTSDKNANESLQTHFIVYKITNINNGKYYIGAHKTADIDDDYMGSGLYIKRAIEEHGLESFKKEILFECSSQEEMFLKEKEEIDKNGYYPQNKMSYNLKQGGYGGWPYFEVSPMRGRTLSTEVRQKVSKLTIEAMHRPDVRKKYLEANAKVNRAKEHNTMYGDTRVFVSNIEQRRIIRIDREKIQEYLENGWTLGRSDKLKYFTYEGATKGKHILVLLNVDSIPDGYYRGRDGKFAKDGKIDQKYVHPSKRRLS